MRDADGRTLDHVVLPRRRLGLALLERYFPSPADNLLDAELAAFATAGDTVLDPWAGTGWTARRAIAHGMRAIAADPSPFAQLAAQAMLGAIEPMLLDAAHAQVAASRRVDVPLRQHVDELYATRCPTCRAPVVGEQFIWPRGGAAPGRKIFRCATCDLAIGGPMERVAPVDETDLAKLGIERLPAPEVSPVLAPDAEDDLPPAPIGLTAVPDGGIGPLGERGGPPPPPPLEAEPPASALEPRFASTVRPEPRPGAVGDVRQGLAYQQLRDRFPILDGRAELVDELLALYTPRNLDALQAIAAKIDSEIRDGPIANALRLALAACLLPASKLNGYPGRVASLRISAGHVRQPASRHHREVNVWRLFESAVADVRTAVSPVVGDRHAARFAADAGELGGMSAANVLWMRCQPATIGQQLPEDSVDLVLGAPPPAPSLDELSFEYLATAFLLGREAAATLRLEPLFSAPARHDGAEATAMRRALASAAGTLKPGGWCSLLLDGDDPDRLVAAAVAAAASGLRLVSIVPRESRASGDGAVLHLRKRSGEDRLQDAVNPSPLRLGTEAGQLTYPELVAAIDTATVSLLRDRGEPAALQRIASAVLLELERRGLLARLALGRVARMRMPGDAADDGERGGAPLLIALLREELGRPDHAALVRLDGELPTWWLRDPQLAATPLADRVEWAAYSLLSTAGGLDESAFLDRLYRLFPGTASPDEELARACLAAYATIGEGGRLVAEDELAQRLDDHARIIATLVDYGHRIGMRAWIARGEQRRPHGGGLLGAWLSDGERRAYLPLVVRAPAAVVSEVDAIWYVRGKLAFLFEVEWTAMIGRAVLERGRKIVPDEQQARFLVIPAERADLLRLKLSRSPWLRTEMERQNWHVLKWQHLETIARRPVASLEALEPVLGLDPLIERGGEQLTMFGE